ncbi:MAG: hypothetical protein K0S33_1262 [Bacteroidetes bacterium]|jgi:uncharacterized protein (DUF2147 family)|nr:hypothetical protein [Bacteroidota bacterium]
MRTLFILLIAFATITVKAQTITENMIIGTWLTDGGKAKVQIYKSGERYNGKIVWLKTPNYEDGTPKIDKNNPDKNRQKDPILGLNLLKGFVFDEDQWEDGTIYDPENGKTYLCKITYNKGGWLQVRGFIGVSLIGRTQTWYKVGDVK